MTYAKALLKERDRKRDEIMHAYSLKFDTSYARLMRIRTGILNSLVGMSKDTFPESFDE